MKTQKLMYALAACGLLFASCDQYNHEPSVSTHQALVADSTEITSTDSERIIIKTAELKLQVDSVPEKIKQIQNRVNAMNGHVIHYEINANKNHLDDVECSLDSSFVIDQINPTAFMKIKIPVQYTDTFIQQMLSMNVSINHFLLDENDITEDLQEKKELAQIDVVGKTKPKTLMQQSYLEDRKEKLIQRKADFAKLDYKTKYLWFDISLAGNSYIEKNKIANVKTFHTPFYVKAFSAIDSGWRLFAAFIIALLNLWPFLIATIICIVAVKKNWFGFKKVSKVGN